MKTNKLTTLIFIILALVLLGGLGWFRLYQSQDSSTQIQDLEDRIAELTARLEQENNEEAIPSPDSEENDEEILRVDLARAEIPGRAETITYDGVIEPSRTTIIIPLMPGEVTKVLVDKGDRVNQGDLLLKMDTREIDKNIEQAQAGVESAKTQLDMAKEGLRQEEIDQIKETVKQAETQLELAEASYERIKTLRDEGIVSEQEYEQVLTEKNIAHSNLITARINLDMAQSGARDLEIQAARAQLRQAEIQLELAEMARDDARITSPRDGVIISREVEPGELIGEAQPPLVLGSLDPLHLNIKVGERDIGLVEKGQEANISLRALSDKKIVGIVKQVSPVADPDSRLFKVTIEIENPGQEIRPGMYAEGTIIIDTGPQYPVIPEEAVHSENDGKYVYTVRDDRVSPRPVSTGDIENGQIQITSGLQEGEKVIVGAEEEIVPGQKIEPRGGDLW